MLTAQLVVELRIVLNAQNNILRDIKEAVSEMETTLVNVETSLTSCDIDSKQIRQLEALMDELEFSQGLLKQEDFGDFDSDQILRLYENRQQAVLSELKQIGFRDWESFVRQCKTSSLFENDDPLAAYEMLLTEADLKKLREESYDAQYQWDPWDYAFVGTSGVLASLTDFLLVKIPTTMSAGEFAGQEGSPITAWLKQYNTNDSDDWFAQLAKGFSETCKVPYDAIRYEASGGNSENIPGMGGKTHRSQSIGHDPILGFVFGVLDIMQGTITGFSYDKSTQYHTWTHETSASKIDPVGLIEAVLRQLGHLISDVATPMGLPAPFMTLIQGINVGSFGEKKRTVGEIARWMYLNGYDLRHFLVSGITPAVIEIILRGYIMLKHYSEHGELKFDLASHPKYRTMLLMAHGIATLGNAGKITLMQGNPLAINYAEWVAFVRYLVPSMKYWIFDQRKLRIDHLENINAVAWDSLLQNSDQLLTAVAKLDTQEVILGTL
jgi:hypothetical protein